MNQSFLPATSWALIRFANNSSIITTSWRNDQVFVLKLIPVMSRTELTEAKTNTCMPPPRDLKNPEQSNFPWLHKNLLKIFYQQIKFTQSWYDRCQDKLEKKLEF